MLTPCRDVIGLEQDFGRSNPALVRGQPVAGLENDCLEATLMV